MNIQFTEAINMKKVLLILTIFLISTAVYAQDLEISYFDGDVEIFDSGEWFEPEIGESISGNQKIKLGNDSYAEIVSPKSTIKLLKKGEYSVSALLESAGTQNTWELGKIGGINFKNIINKGAYNSSAVMGVRGAKQETGEIEWIDSSIDYLTEGKIILDEGNIDGALNLFNEGIDLSEDDIIPLYYHSALCYSLQGKNNRSLKNLNMVITPETYDFYPDFVILKSNILLEGLEYKDADLILRKYIKSDNKSEKAQIMYLLLSYSANGMGNDDDAKMYLDKVMEINSSNDMGKIAEDLLGKM
jgi:tetratricopeptide (TPR) repeat protein